MDVREKLVELLAKYFDIGDSYAYNLTRVKSAFACGTVGLDDFEEFDDETVSDIADYLIANGVTAQEPKLGDKIYQTDGVRIYESIISEITLTAKHTIFVTENVAFDERAIGNGVFLSYDEAEAHLPQPPKGELLWTK